MKKTLKPSQWVNFGWLLFAIAGCILVIPVIIWICRVFIISCWSYRFDEDTDTIVERKGVFSVETVEIHYFRIKSIRLQQPFFQRLVGLSTIEVITSEPYKPYLEIYGIRDGAKYVKYLKETATYWRNVKGVKETDFHSF